MAKTIDLRRAYSVEVNNPSTGLATEVTLDAIKTQTDKLTFDATELKTTGGSSVVSDIKFIELKESLVSGDTESGVGSVSISFDGANGTLNGVTVPNRYVATFTPNMENDTVGSIPYTVPTTKGLRVLLSYIYKESPFIITVDTTKSGSASDTFILPLQNDTTNLIIDWGDGNINTIVTYNDANLSHTYSSGGVYTVTVKGQFGGVFFSNAGDKLKLMTIEQWGDNAFTSMSNSFYGCANLTANYSDVPNTSSVTSLSRAFYGATLFNGALNDIDTSGVTALDHVFTIATSFNQDISSWDVGSATTMYNMLFGASSFNNGGVALDWTSANSTTNRYQMLYNATSFNQDISAWDISSTTNMSNMLFGTAFNTTNYDLLLVAWEGQTEQAGVAFHAGTAKYSAGAPATARGVLTGTSTWSITDGGSV